RTEKEEIESENTHQYSMQKRNFFAHSGLLREYIKLKKENGMIYLSYTEDCLPIIKKWIKKPEEL
ncbi:MAG: hypothetical protein QXP38_06920, partial [Nitrososphaerota archaeon]